jgi:phosphate uptake regulator
MMEHYECKKRFVITHTPEPCHIAHRSNALRRLYRQRNENTGRYLGRHYILVAWYVERCADHTCKIAENVHYMDTEERIEIH